jgi:4-methyl-5(b-hydroxyethyl)-thiazole monophosphate biosynthesis
MAEALVLIAEGSEEIEAVTPGDVLVRAGVSVLVAGVGGVLLRGSRGLLLAAEVEAGAIGDRLFDAVILPGGAKGAEHLAASESVARIVRAHASAGKIIAAICAAPAVVLGPLGMLEGRRATCYPGLEAGLTGATHTAGDVVVDGALVTSRGPGTALAFSLELAARLAGRGRAGEVRRAMLAGD